MRYGDMEKGFQHAFAAAVRAYRRGSTPIGCAILDGEENLIALGENSIYANDNHECINNHHLAHAEINALLKIPRGGTGRNTLYTTMEPCILCFGAVVMSYHRSIRFASKDMYGGATALNSALDFVVRQNIAVSGPVPALQEIQIAMTTFRHLELGFDYYEKYNTYCPEGVSLGVKLSRDERFVKMIKGGAVESEVLDYMFVNI